MVIIEKSRAWHALVELLESEGQRAIAERTGVSQPMLSLIASLKREPGAGTKIKFENTLSILIGWWDEPVPEGSKPIRVSRRQSQVKAAEGPAQ